MKNVWPTNIPVSDLHSSNFLSSQFVMALVMGFKSASRNATNILVGSDRVYTIEIERKDVFGAETRRIKRKI